MDSYKEHTEKIKQKAINLGFNACGISKAEKLTSESENLKHWLENGYHASMKYMENHFEKRIDPQKLVEGTKSVISLILNYKTSKIQDANTYQISKYAYGKDYHFVIKRKLKELLVYIEDNIPGASGRAFVDSAPVMDREWAYRSGLGWIGKHSLLINKEIGSYIFIGELLVNIELEYDTPVENYCGSCTRCMDSCPTGAIVKDGVIDSNKCISYHTIENREQIDIELNGKFKNYIFGCDICQEVCPWNNKKIYTNEKSFIPSDDLLSLNKLDFEILDKTDFKRVFKHSAVKRTGFGGLKRNITYLNQTDF